MFWNKRYMIKSYVKGSLWFVPFICIIAFWVISRITNGIDSLLVDAHVIDETTDFYGLSMAGAKAMLDTIITLNLSFLVFTFGSLLVAVQIAGGQYTPRIIATTLLRDNRIRSTVGYFVFTLLFSVKASSRMGDEVVNQFNTFIVGVLGLVSVVVFLYLIDYAARFLRPVSIVKRVGESGLAVINSVYPGSIERLHPAKQSRDLSSPERTVVHAGTSGIVLAVDLAGLVERARKAGGTIDFVPQIGDFVAVDEPLFHLFGGANKINDQQLRGAVAFGSERTLEQDPTFAFRILVDIAIKALSPAINDPTTAALAIDQLHRLLRRIGLRHTINDEIFDDSGALRLVFRTPHWEDFVHLACTEIRHCGGGSIQVMRRMRSMLENLMQTLPAHRHVALKEQLDFLDRTIEKHYAFPEDRMMARIADPQGLGGALGMQDGQK